MCINVFRCIQVKPVATTFRPEVSHLGLEVFVFYLPSTKYLWYEERDYANCSPRNADATCLGKKYITYS